MKTTITLGDLFEKPISGEWGTDPTEKAVNVLRTTNFRNDGRLNLSSVVKRDIDAKKVAQKQLKPGDIIIEKSGGSPTQPVGRVVYFDLDQGIYLCNNFTAVLRPKPGIHPRYALHLLYGLHVNKTTLAFQNKTTGIINLKLTNYLSDVKVPLPPLAEQIHIAQVLDQADRLRQQDRQLLAHYDQLVQAVFVKLFGAANPESAKWLEIKIAELASITKNSMRTGPFGSDLLHSEFVEQGVFVLGIDNVVNNRFEWAKPRFITNEKYEKLKRYTVFPGDVLVSIMGTIGRTAVVPSDVPEAINSKHLAAITLNQQLAVPAFVSYSLYADPHVTRQLAARSKGAIMDGLNLGIIKDTKLRLPPIALQQKFASIQAQIEAQKAATQQLQAQSEALFNSLLQQAFRGELGRGPVGAPAGAGQLALALE